MSIGVICGNCSVGRHDHCQDGTTPGLIGGWYCICSHTPEGDIERAKAVAALLDRAYRPEDTKGGDDE